MNAKKLSSTLEFDIYFTFDVLLKLRDEETEVLDQAMKCVFNFFAEHCDRKMIKYSRILN